VFGYYELDGCALGGSYVLKPEKSNDARNSITAFDASMVLRYAVDLIDLDPCQQIAGDVSDNCMVTAYDASFILRYVVGLIDSLPIGQEWTFVPREFDLNDTNWCWAPDTLVVSNLTDAVDDADFKGILYGDVSGNWIYNGGPLVSPGPMAGAFDKLGGGTQTVASGTEFVIPINVSVMEETYSASLSLEYEHELIELLRVETSELTKDFLLEKRVDDGTLSIAMAAAQPLTGSGSIAHLVFRVSADAADGASGSVVLTGLTVDETPVSDLGEVARFAVGSHPHEYSLLQNYPNPFNPSTTISFVLGEKSDYKLTIYNVTGQVVQTFDRTAEAGEHSVVWDAADNSSGVYFYKLEAGNFSSTKKMVLLK